MKEYTVSITVSDGEETYNNSFVIEANSLEEAVQELENELDL